MKLMWVKSGAMGGFAVFSSFGFYPLAGRDENDVQNGLRSPANAGTGVYVLSTPLFRTITFPASAAGKKAVITTVNFDGATKNKYVQSATLNGRPFTRNWFSHNEFFGAGGTLKLILGPKPSSRWGTAKADLPPSFSTSKSLAPFS